MTGIIIKTTGTWYTVRMPDGSTINCRKKGKLRLSKFKVTNPIVVGDQVECEKEEGFETGTIWKILTRKNYFVRQSVHGRFESQIVASNLDQLLLVASLKSPVTGTGFIDRALITAEAYNIPAVILFNKADIYKKPVKIAYQKLSETYGSAGYTTYLIAAKTGYNMEIFKEFMRNKISLLIGQSGVGKSTFINYLIPGSVIPTAEVSKKTGKGIHTTSFSEMLELPFSGWIIDTPGIKELGLIDMKLEDITHFFPEMKEVSKNCQFNNCLHLTEPGCAVKEALEIGIIHASRYNNYSRIITEKMNEKPDYEK